MRKHLLLSTAAVGLMLASGLAYAQSPAERQDEPKRTEEPRGAAPQRGAPAAAQQAQEKTGNAAERAQAPAREERGARSEAAGEKKQPAAAERNPTKEQAQDARDQGRERAREVEGAKSGRDAGKSSAETKPDKAAPQKSAAESEKSKTDSKTEARSDTKSEAKGNAKADTTSEPSKNAADKTERDKDQRNASEPQTSRPATASDTSRPSSTDRAQGNPANTQVNSQTNAQVNAKTRVTTEKQVRISETISRERLAETERNLNVSIRIGETIPPRVRLHRLPPEIIAIEPEYRDYEYFATDDDVVIVEPRTHRIISQVPRDPSRARAQLSSGASSTVATAGGSAGSTVNCRIMRRDAAGNVVDVEPATVGSSARTDGLSVIVQLPGGASQPIALGAPAGDIVVATQGQGDCTVTLEPQTR